jgi:hypothetical protein
MEKFFFQKKGVPGALREGERENWRTDQGPEPLHRPLKYSEVK